MTETPQSRAARLAHLRRAGLEKGDPVPLPLTMAAMYHLPGDPAGFNQYGRFNNPTWDAVEELLGHLEAATAIAFPSGMAAISAVLFGLLRAGDRILLPSDGYYTTRVLADRFLKPMGVAIDTRPTASFLDGGFEGYRLVLLETPSNPNLDICDIAAVAAAAHQAGAIVVADNTTMTPYGQRPLDLGADVVVAADTKAPNGHSDVLFGHVSQPQPRDPRGGERLAETVGRHPRPVRGMAGPPRAGDAGGPLRPHVQLGRDHRRPPRRTSCGRRRCVFPACPTIPPTIWRACRWTASAS